MRIIKIFFVTIIGVFVVDSECSRQKTLSDFFSAQVQSHPTIQNQDTYLDAWENTSFVGGYPNAQGVIQRVLDYYDSNGYTTGLPHLAILKTTDDSGSTVHNFLFLSGSKTEASIERLQSKLRNGFNDEERQILLDNCCTIGTCGYGTSDPRNIAHSEVAIGLHLKNKRGPYKMIQIKNAWSMCENCKNFWSGLVKINDTTKMVGNDGQIFRPQNTLGKFQLRVHVKNQAEVVGY